MHIRCPSGVETRLVLHPAAAGTAAASRMAIVRKKVFMVSPVNVDGGIISRPIVTRKRAASRTGAVDRNMPDAYPVRAKRLDGLHEAADGRRRHRQPAVDLTVLLAAEDNTVLPRSRNRNREAVS